MTMMKIPSKEQDTEKSLKYFSKQPLHPMKLMTVGWFIKKNGKRNQ